MSKPSIEEQLKSIKKIVHDEEVVKITVRGKVLVLADVLDTVLPFGKYRGESLKNIAQSDPKYIEWLATQDLEESRLELKIDALVVAMRRGKV